MDTSASQYAKTKCKFINAKHTNTNNTSSQTLQQNRAIIIISKKKRKNNDSFEQSCNLIHFNFKNKRTK